MTGTIIRRITGTQDISFADGGTGAAETFTYIDLSGNLITLTKVDAFHLKFRTLALSVDDLVDGGKNVTIKPLNIDAGGDCNIAGTLTVGGANTLSNLGAGYVKSSAAGLLSSGAIAEADLPVAINAAKIADGSVSNAEFQFINTLASNVQTQINAIIAGAAVQPSFALLQNRRAQNTAGGTATSGSWLIIPINTEQEDADGIVDSSALPAFTLAAGTYRIQAVSPFYYVARVQTRIYNVTDATVSIVGSSAYVYEPYQSSSSFLSGTITIAATKQFRLEYQCAASQATNGLGIEDNFGVEVYAQVEIVKIA